LQAEQGKLSKLLAEPCDAEMDSVLAKLEASTKEKEQRAAHISSAKLDPNALDFAIRKHNFFRAVWMRRKANANEVVSDIAASLDKKTSDLFNDMGLDSDADAGKNHTQADARNRFLKK